MLLRPQVKYIQSLGQKKFRDEEGVFVAEGPKLVSELLGAPNTRPVSIYALKDWLEEKEDSGWPSAIPVPPVTVLKQEELERISSLVTPNRVLAVFTKPAFPPPDYAHAFSLLLDGIQDPGNMGTIIRIADWFGIRQVACSADCADVFNSKTVQSTMGSVSRVQVLYEDLGSLIRAHPSLPVYAATLDGENCYQAGRTGVGMLVIGNESKGIRKELLELILHPITIPRIGEAESLNAAVATGILLSHLKEFRIEN